MSPEIEAAIAAIQKLSSWERQQVLQILMKQGDIEQLSHQFWQGVSLDEVLESQNPITVNQPQKLTVEFWPEEESIDDFLTFLREERQSVI